MRLEFDPEIDVAYFTYVCIKCGASSHSSVFKDQHALACTGEIMARFGRLHAAMAEAAEHRTDDKTACYNGLSVAMLEEQGIDELP